MYVRRTDCYALSGPRPPEPERVLFALEGGATLVLRGQPARSEQPRAVPVYELPGGALGVPTGRLFARFREGTDASAQSAALASVGYEIVEIPGWAPHAAWIQALGGDPGQSLDAIGALQHVSALENVEPQVLGRTVRKNSRT